MINDNLITLERFCVVHEIQDSFIFSLKEFDLIEVVTIEEIHYIRLEQLSTIERMIRLHFDLNINFEGIDTITNLVQKVENLQQELAFTKNKLRLYEE